MQPDKEQVRHPQYQLLMLLAVDSVLAVDNADKVMHPGSVQHGVKCVANVKGEPILLECPNDNTVVTVGTVGTPNQINNGNDGLQDLKQTPENVLSLCPAADRFN